MDDNRRRSGDDRPLLHDPEVSLTMLPAHGQPFRWLPRHGQPSCIGEWLTQNVVRQVARPTVYTAIVSTLTLIVVVGLWLQ